MACSVDLADGHCEDSVSDEPHGDHVRPDGAVVVLLHLGGGRARGRDLDAVAQVAEGFVVAGVDVELFGGHVEFDGARFAGGGAEVGGDDVVALCTPGDVVGVAEGIDLEGADVGGEEGEVLRRGSEHVPRVQIEEGHEEVEADGGAGRDDQVGEDVVAHAEVGGGLELFDHDVDGGEGRVGHYDGVGHEGGEVHLFGALGPVAHREDELHGDEEDAGVAQDVENVFAEVGFAGGIDLGVGQGAGDEVEGEVEVAEGEPGEEERDELVDELDV